MFITYTIIVINFKILNASDADSILKGLFHKAVSLNDIDSKKQALLKYLIAVGSAVPHFQSLR